jgi:hypothetical protein
VKKLPASYRAFSKQVRDAAERLSNAGEIHRHLKGKTALYFPAEPLAALDAAIPRLAGRALDKVELKQLAEEVTPGHAVVLDEWLKRALTQRLLYEHAPATKGAGRRFGAEPDVRKLAAPLLKALRKARDNTDANGISRERLAELLLEELGVSLGDATRRIPSKANDDNAPDDKARSRFLAALAELVTQNPRQALLSVRDLRARLGLGKDQFDALALVLMRDGAISLHQHDHPMSLSERDRQQLVDNARGTYYVGIAPRSGQ